MRKWVFCLSPFLPLFPWVPWAFSACCKQEAPFCQALIASSLILSDRKTNETWVHQKITFISCRNMLIHHWRWQKWCIWWERGQSSGGGCEVQEEAGRKFEPSWSHLLQPSVHRSCCITSSEGQATRQWGWVGLQNHLWMCSFINSANICCRHVTCQMLC